MNVLIVDQNTEDRELLRSTLEHYGCTIIEAVDGLEGLDCAIHQQPDIIISNTLMSYMDGFQLLWALKSDPKLTSIPFLFYSDTYAGKQEEKLALSIGAEAYIVKKDGPEKVWACVSKVLLSGKPYQETPGCPDIEKKSGKYLWEYGRINATKLQEKVRELEEATTRCRKHEEELRILNAELTLRITERQRAEETIREKEQEIDAIFEAAPSVMLLLDGERKIRRANTAACSFTDISAADMIGQKGGEALRCVNALNSSDGCGFSPSCRQCALRLNIINTFETGRGHHELEVSLPLSNSHQDKSFTFLMSTTRITAENQNMVVLGIQDITGQKELEKQLQQARKMESAGFLAGNFANEINKMLITISEYASNALMNIPSDHPQHQNIEQILNVTNKAASITDGLFMFSKKQGADKKFINLNIVITSMKSSLKRILGCNIAYSTELPDIALPIFVDEHQLERIMIDLATNARSAMPKGGSLTISTGRTEIDNAFIAAHGFGYPGSYAVLSIKDTGMGMDTQMRQHIFDPFFTAQKDGTWSAPGMAVVLGVLQQHDSYINVMSEPGHGTTIEIYIPLVAAEAEEEKREPEVKSPAPKKETILLAEDDESVRNMAMALLQHFGYEVITAIDGEDAVMKYKEHAEKIHLLLFDLVMPKMTGNEAYHEIKKLKPDIKVMFTSGYIQEIAKNKILADPNAAFILKPYLPTIFMQKVQSILDEAKP